MDVTDMISYNVELLNHNNLEASFFHLHRDDPTVGFAFNASKGVGSTYPDYGSFCEPLCASLTTPLTSDKPDLLLRLRLGSHLAQHLRHQLDEQKGFTSTVGVSTSKLVSKLVGSVNKPNGQTTLIPPYNPHATDGTSNVISFIDDHEISKIPGIGFKSAQKIRSYILGRPAAFSAGLVYGVTKESVKVQDVRTLKDMGPKLLSRLLAGPGAPKDSGERVWSLINGVDNSEVLKAREVPQQISLVSARF